MRLFEAMIQGQGFGPALARFLEVFLLGEERAQHHTGVDHRGVQVQRVAQLDDGLLVVPPLGQLQGLIEVMLGLVDDQPQHRQVAVAVIALFLVVAIFGLAEGTLHR